MRQRLLEIYERELSYLRQMGAEFATRYPAIASGLLLDPDRCADPHVERLLEGFSFLAARIHLRLDDDLPELTEGFLDIVYPHFLRPIPSMSIAEFQLGDEAPTAAAIQTIPAGTELRSCRTVDGLPCRFRTAYPVTLLPFTVTHASWERSQQSTAHGSGAAFAIRIRLNMRDGRAFNKLELPEFNIYLSGDRNVALTLYELLSRNLVDVLVRDLADPASNTVALGASALQSAGFSAAESLLPFSSRSFRGYQLLQEYYAFPEKFLFFTLRNLGQAQRALGSEQIEVLLLLSSFEHPERAQGLEFDVDQGTFRLGCTPIVNLFPQTAEPILVSQTRHEYPVVPDSRHERLMEIYSVDSVAATNPSRRTSTRLSSLFEHQFHSAQSDAEVFWKIRRAPSLIDTSRPPTIYLSLVDPDGRLLDPNAEVLSAYTTCTNHTLPSRLPIGESRGDFLIEGGTTHGPIRALLRPTTGCAPPASDALVWSLISQLSLNHLSLGEEGLPALRELLRLHNFSREGHLNRQIDGMLSLKAKPHLAILAGELGSVAARGTRLDLLLEEEHFVGGGAYLFAAVLDHFFGLYVAMNSFSQLSVRTTSRKEVLAQWQPRAGRQMVI